MGFDRVPFVVAIIWSQIVYSGIHIVDKDYSYRFIKIEASEGRVAFYLCDTFDGVGEEDCRNLADRESYPRSKVQEAASYHGFMKYPKWLYIVGYPATGVYIGNWGWPRFRSKHGCTEAFDKLFYHASWFISGHVVAAGLYRDREFSPLYSARMEEAFLRSSHVEVLRYERIVVDDLASSIEELRNFLNRMVEEPLPNMNP